MAAKIKICGLRRLEDVDIVNEAKPDYAGVVLCKRFWRGIEFEQAKAIRKRLDPNIPLVGVFVNDHYMDVLVSLRQGIVDMVQLQGTESEEYIRDLKFMSRKPVMKSCQVQDPEGISYTVNSEADHIMFSSGNGGTFDWSLLKDVQRPFFLSGGLTAENVTAALETVHPWGVDFFNGVETDGVKDRKKILAAVEAVRQFG